MSRGQIRSVGLLEMEKGRQRPPPFERMELGYLPELEAAAVTG